MRRNLLVVFTAALIFFLISAEQTSAQSDNIGHTRHFHKHNPDHPTEVSESRFHTSRNAANLEIPVEEDAFVFAVFGDRTGGPAKGVLILADAVHDVNLFEPDLVMTVGDLIQGYNATPAWLEQMEEYRGIMDELICPWFPVAGNHDVYWRGANKPFNEHDENYEMHFGPLWYAFEHKNSWFIALYSDEGNPNTGEKNFRKPESQKMSPQQYEWLSNILEKASEADHVFIFLHHPRWLGNNYGNDWERIHQKLVEAGNVSAVFAGHIHRMRSDPKDGIEYITLATVGGGQAGSVPKSGWLHHYDLVTVRKNQIALASIPVGEVLDPRLITGKVSAETAMLSKLDLENSNIIKFEEDLKVSQSIQIQINNPTTEVIEISLTPESKDSRWFFRPDHHHQTIQPGKTGEVEFSISRGAEKIDQTFHSPSVRLSIDYLCEGFRYPIPDQEFQMKIDYSTMDLNKDNVDRVLTLDGKGDVLRLKNSDASFPNGAMTLEAWFEGDSFKGRTGLITKTESSEYGIFVTDGKPSFIINLDGKYVNAHGSTGLLKPHQLYHIAGVYDGKEVRLYLDGDLIHASKGSGKRQTNKLDLLIGGDVDGDNKPTSTFAGKIHAIKLSRAALYSGKTISPTRKFESDEHTVFVSNMDLHIRNQVINESGFTNFARLQGNAKLSPLELSVE